MYFELTIDSSVTAIRQKEGRGNRLNWQSENSSHTNNNSTVFMINNDNDKAK